MNGLAVQQSFAGPLLNDLSLEDVRQVLAVFAVDLVCLCNVLSDAARTGDAAVFRRAARGLGGAAGAVGAARLSRICRDATERTLDATTMQDSVAAIRDEAGPIEAELGRVLAWLGVRT